MNQAASRPEDLNPQFVLTEAERQILEAQANEVIAQLQQSSDAWQHVERGLRQLAAQEMNEAAQITLGVVDKSLAQANTSVDASAIKQQLTQLEQRFKQIEPQQFPTHAKLFGFIPVPSPLPRYFAQYQACSRSSINYWRACNTVKIPYCVTMPVFNKRGFDCGRSCSSSINTSI